MNTVYIPEGYRPCLNSYDTQLAIGMTKRLFADVLAGQDVSAQAAAAGPIYYELIPLTLEEIFIYELGGVDYAVNEIIL